jgi:hypothetical protein
MKAFKLGLILLLALGLALGIAFYGVGCKDDPQPTPTPQTPTPPDSPCTRATEPCDGYGSWCSLSEQLFNGYCLLYDDETEQDIITEAEFGDVICSLNVFWSLLADELADGSMDKQAVTDAFGDLLADNQALLVSTVTPLLGDLNICEDTGDGSFASTLLGFEHYVTELLEPPACLADDDVSDCPDGSLWGDIGSFVGMVGLTVSEAATLIDTVLTDLNKSLGLVEDGTNVPAGTSIIDGLTTAANGCFTDASGGAYDNENLIALLEYLDNDGIGETDADRDNAISGLLAPGGEADILIGGVVELLAGMDLAELAGLIGELPTIIGPMITQELTSNCP